MMNLIYTIQIFSIYKVGGYDKWAFYMMKKQSSLCGER